MPQPPFPGIIGRTIAESRPGWPPRPDATGKPPNALVVLFDDVVFADFSCYGAAIRTPAIDALAARGLRQTGFHTTALCRTTRAALMTGCKHQRMRMDCLAKFDSRHPAYRAKIAPELVRDNTPIPCPGSHAGGYHLSVDLVDRRGPGPGRDGPQ